MKACRSRAPRFPVEAKLRLLDALGETGAKVISIGSFAHPKWTPQMACIEEIAERFVPRPGVKYTAAVFNKNGYDRADRFFPKIDVRSTGRGFRTFVELCDTFARRNYNRTQAQQIAAMDATIAAAKAAGVEQRGGRHRQPVRLELRGPVQPRAAPGPARRADRQVAGRRDPGHAGVAARGDGLEPAPPGTRDDRTSQVPEFAGRFVVIDGMSRFELRDGLIADYRESVNGGVAMAQLGVAAPRIEKVLARWGRQLRELPATQAWLAEGKRTA